jgi:Uma2 family endonuclease
MNRTAAEALRLRLEGFLRARWGHFTIERNPDTAVGPDLAFVAKERLPKKLPKEYLALAPNLVLEVRSPDLHQAERSSEYPNPGLCGRESENCYDFYL